MARDSDPAEWHRLASAWIDRLREESIKPIVQVPEPKDSAVIAYRTFQDGSAFHTQDMGWRMAADVLYQHLLERRTPRPGRTEEETKLHTEFDALAARQIGYVYLASWRLSIEIALKQALSGLHLATQTPPPATVKQLLRGHDISGLWRRFIAAIPDFLTALRQTAVECGIDPDGTGFALDPTEQQEAVDLIYAIDPDGQSLRYRENLDGAANMSAVHQIDIKRAHYLFTNLVFFLQLFSSRAASVQQIRECREIATAREEEAKRETNE